MKARGRVLAPLVWGIVPPFTLNTAVSHSGTDKNITDCVERLIGANFVIIDAHVHLPCYDDSLVSLTDKKRCLLDDMKEAGVDAAIVIADSTLSSVIGTPSDCVGLFEDSLNIFVMGGVSPLIEYDARLEELEQYLRQKTIVAIKLYPGHEAFYMDDPRLNKAIRLCEDYDVPLAVHTGWENPQYDHPRYLAEIARKYPELRLVICHMYWPDIDMCYDITAACSNVYYDISSLAYNKAVLPNTIASLNRVAKASASRLLFGSDYGACSVGDHVNLIKSLEIPEDEKQRILYKNAIDIYGLTMVE